MFGHYDINDLYFGAIVRIKAVKYPDNLLYGNIRITKETVEYGVFTKSNKTGVDFVRVTTGEKFEICDCPINIGDYRVDQSTIEELKYCLKPDSRKKMLSKKDIKIIESAIYDKMQKEKKEQEKTL